MKTLLMTVGLPRAGKSTWAKQQPYPVVNPDSIRLALHGTLWNPLCEPFVWAICHVMVKALFLAGADTVVLDATNTTRKRRDEWVSSEWTRKFRVFGAPKDLCLERAGENKTLAAFIEKMDAEWESLVPEEYQ